MKSPLMLCLSCLLVDARNADLRALLTNSVPVRLSRRGSPNVPIRWRRRTPQDKRHRCNHLRNLRAAKRKQPRKQPQSATKLTSELHRLASASLTSPPTAHRTTSPKVTASYPNAGSPQAPRALIHASQTIRKKSFCRSLLVLETAWE
jgi:hypothetical protein